MRLNTTPAAWQLGQIFQTLILVLTCSSLLLMSLTAVARATEPELIITDEDSYDLTPFITLLEDPEGTLTIDDIVTPKYSSQFKPSEQSYLNFGYSDSTYWIKLNLRYVPMRKRHLDTTHWFFEAGKSQLNVSEFYNKGADGKYVRTQADIRIPYAERPMRMVTSILPITTHRDETYTYYLKIANNSAFYVPLKLWKAAEFTRKTAREEFLYGIFYGGMIIIILYNIFLYIAIRELSYIFYVGYLVSASVFEIVDMGHGAALFESGLKWFNKEYIPVAIWCTWLFSCAFTRRFLDLPLRHPLIDSFLKPNFVFAILCTFSCLFMPYKLSLYFSVHFCGYMVTALPLVGAYAWYSGNRNASFFTIAWIFNSLGFVLLSTVATGRAPATPLFIAAMPAGTLLEAALLSFALAERMKRAQKDALEANHRSMQHMAGYRSIFENALEGIYQINLRGKLISANFSLAKYLGYSSVQLLLRDGSKNLLDFFEASGRQWREIMNGTPHKNLIERLDSQGVPLIAIHSAQLIRDTHGNPSYIEGRVVDITERHQREKAQLDLLRERREKSMAEAATHAKSEFLTNMSFEIRTSLSPIIGFSEALREPELAPEYKHLSINAVIDNAQTLLQLVNDILDYSKIEAGKMTIEAVDVDLFSLIDAISATYAPLAAQKQLRWLVELEWPLPARIMSDPTRIKQILQNLCSNAIKVTYSGFIKLRVYWNDANDELVFAVTDTGPGISTKNIALMTEDAAAGDNGKLQRGGLGIAITRTLSKMMGGRMTIASESGQGSTFFVSIRCKTPPRETWATAPIATTARNVGPQAIPKLSGRVLLAEDNPVNQKLISRIITKTGAEVIIAGDGQQAVSAAKDSPFDLILMDVNMPVVGGLEATALLRTSGYSNPIYALTAEHGVEEVNASLAAGCNGHLTKPIELTPFYQVLSQHLAPQEETP